MWDLPRPGLEPVSPALAGGFLTTAPPGKSTILNYRVEIYFNDFSQFTSKVVNVQGQKSGQKCKNQACGACGGPDSSSQAASQGSEGPGWPHLLNFLQRN